LGRRLPDRRWLAGIVQSDRRFAEGPKKGQCAEVKSVAEFSRNLRPDRFDSSGNEIENRVIVRDRRSPAWEDNDVSACRRTTYSLNIASGRSTVLPEDDFSLGVNLHNI